MTVKENWKTRIGKINKTKFVRKVRIFFKKLVLPGFEGVPFLQVMKFFIESLVKGILFQRAAAMTYGIFIALIPMLMALFSAISFLGEPIRLQLMDFIQTLVPDYTWPAVFQMISSVIMKQNEALLFTSFGIGFYLSVMCMNSVITSLNITYFDIKKRSFLKQILTSILMVIGFGIFIIAAVALFIGTSYALKHLNLEVLRSPMLYAYTISFFKWLFLFALAYIFISALFYFAPVNKKYFRFFSAGSTFTTLLLLILFYILNFYFNHFPTYNIIYGSLGALFAIMLLLYLSSIVILIGFDLNVSIFVAKEQKKKGIKSPVLESTIKENEPIFNDDD